MQTFPKLNITVPPVSEVQADRRGLGRSTHLGAKPDTSVLCDPDRGSSSPSWQFSDC